METTRWVLGIGVLLAVAGLFGDRARKQAPLAWHAYLPWNAIVFVGLAIALFATVHLIGGRRPG